MFMDDLIDFKVSDDWLDYYHDRGLTPRESGKRMNELIRAVETLAEESKKTNKLLAELIRGLDDVNKNRKQVYRNNR